MFKIGSTDNTLEICKNIERHEKSVKVISQKNSGVSKARNVGIEYANGDYIIFVDADDYLEKNMFEILINNVSGFDMSVVTYTRNDCIEACGIDNIEKKYSQREFFVEIFRNKKILGFLWNKLFKLDFIKENNIRFDEKIFICEDMLFVVQYLKYCKKIHFVEKELYHYISRQESALNKKNNDKWLTILDSYKKIIEINEFKEYESIVLFYYLKILIESFEYTNVVNTYEMNECIMKINFDLLNFKEKLIYFLIKIDYRLFIKLKKWSKK